MADNDLVQGSMHNGRWVSAEEKKGRGFDNYDQMYGNSHKMNTQFGYENTTHPLCNIEHIPGSGPTSFKHILIAFTVMILGSWLALTLMFGEKTPRAPISNAVNQIKDGSATRSQYVQSIALSDKTVKLGVRKDGSVKSMSEISNDYNNVLRGVLPQSEINDLLSFIKRNYTNPNFYLKDIQSLRWAAERYRKTELFDKQLAQFYLNSLYYDPAYPDQKYNFVYNSANGTSCDINNSCVSGPKYTNLSYGTWKNQRSQK